jgi:colanic acid/amylovoran biosynthesis glycosyltransferase
MIRVIHRLPAWLPLTEHWLYDQILFLPKTVESLIICDRVLNPEEFPGPEVALLDGGGFVDAVLRRFRLRVSDGSVSARATRFGAKVLHSHFGHTGWRDLQAASTARLKHVVSFYGFDVGRLPQRDPAWASRYRAMFERVDRVLCEGPHLANCIEELGCSRDRIQIHHLGIRVKETEFRPRLWRAGDPLHVLIAASFREKKGIPYALKALGRLRQTVALEITVIGNATDDPGSQRERQVILDTIDAEDLSARVRLRGFVNRPTLLREAYDHHVFLSPSITATDGDTEGGAPITLIEMAATGMPVVATTHCDIPNIIEDGSSGLLAPERDVDGLVERVQWLIAHPDRWAEMARRARARIELEFDALKQGERLCALYEQL